MPFELLPRMSPTDILGRILRDESHQFYWNHPNCPLVAEIVLGRKVRISARPLLKQNTIRTWRNSGSGFTNASLRTYSTCSSGIYSRHGQIHGYFQISFQCGATDQYAGDLLCDTCIKCVRANRRDANNPLFKSGSPMPNPKISNADTFDTKSKRAKTARTP